MKQKKIVIIGAGVVGKSPIISRTTHTFLKLRKEVMISFETSKT